jgi:hypothetical protein
MSYPAAPRRSVVFFVTTIEGWVVFVLSLVELGSVMADTFNLPALVALAACAASWSRRPRVTERGELLTRWYYLPVRRRVALTSVSRLEVLVPKSQNWTPGGTYGVVLIAGSKRIQLQESTSITARGAQRWCDWLGQVISSTEYARRARDRTWRLRLSSRVWWSLAALPPAVLLLSIALAAHVVPAVWPSTVVSVLMVWWCARCWGTALVVRGREVVVSNPFRTVTIGSAAVAEIHRGKCGPFGSHLEGAAPCLWVHLEDNRKVPVVASYNAEDLPRLLAEVAAALVAAGADQRP